MANKYWVGGTGTWDATSTTNWSLTSGGTGGAAVPTTADVAIFDSASNAAGGGASYTCTIIAATAVSGINMSNPLTGILTFDGSSNIVVTTSGLTISGTINWFNTGIVSFTDNTSICNTGTSTIASPIIIDSTDKTVTLNDNFSTTSTLTLTSGILDLNNKMSTFSTFLSNNSNTRAINFGTTGYITLNGTGTIWNTATATGLTTSGTSRVDCTNSSATARTVIAGGLSEDYVISFNITAGTGPITFTANDKVKSLNFTGFAGSWTNVALGIYGSLIVSTGMTVTAGTRIVSFLSSYTGNTINPNGKTLGFPIVFNGLFGRWTLAGQLSTGTTSTSTITLAAGYLDLNGNDHSCPAFITNSTFTRILAFNFGSLTLNGTGTVWDATSVYNMTVTGTPIVNVTNATATARTIIAGSPSEANSVSFNISAGTSSTTITGSVRNLVFTGFTGTWPNSAITIYGNLTLSTGMTVTAGAGLRTFASTSTGKIITSSGKSLGCPVTFNGIGGGWTLADALNIGTNALTLTNGTFNTGNFNITAGRFSSNNNNIRSLNLGSSTITIGSSSTTAANQWSITTTNLTFSAGTSTINFNDSGSVSFSGGGLTYYNVAFTTAGVSTILATYHNIRGNNTFNNLSFTGRTVLGTTRILVYDDQTINNNLSFGTSSGPAYRTSFYSGVNLERKVITAGTISTLTDVDFGGITAAGTSGTWSGTRIGDLTNNSNITVSSPKTVYWNLTGSQLWNANGWASTSGGTPNIINFPLAQDTAIFDNTGLATTVTMNTSYEVGTLDMSARTTAMSLVFGKSAVYFILARFYGDLKFGSGVTPTFVGSGGVYSIYFSGYDKTHTLITAGKSLTNFSFSLENTSTLSLGDALTTTGGLSTYANRGAITTNNFNISASYIYNATSEFPSTFNLGSSTITLTGTGIPAWQIYSTDTVNAGTSTITMTGATANFYGGGKTYNNVSFTNTAITTATIRDVNTFNNLTFTGRTGSAGLSNIVFYADQTISGTLTIGTGTSAIYRTFLQSDTIGAARTITAATESALSDVDFRDIIAAGASGTWTGTRLGDCGNNTNITTSTPKTVFWNLSAGGSWSATAWATTSNGTPAVANFPLAQDTATFTNTGVTSGTSVTMNANWNIGTLDYSARTTASTLAFGTTSPNIYGNVTLYSGLTITGTGIVTFNKSGATQTITSAGVTWSTGINVYNTNFGTTKLGSALTCSRTVSIYTGTLDLDGFTATVSSLQPAVSASIYDFPAIAFGSSAINITGNNGTILYMGVSGGNFNYTGTPTVNLTYSGSTGTRIIFAPGMTETTCFDINITAGSDIISFSTGGVPSIRNYNDTGFTGTYNTASKVNIYGNMTNNSAVLTGFVNFLATSGTKTLTINNTGNACGAFLTFNCPGAIYQLGSAINLAYYSYGATLNTTGGMILKAGTFNANGYDVTVPEFSSSYTSSRALIMGSGNWTIVPYNLTYFQYVLDVSAYSALIPIFGWDISDPTNLTLDKGTANIICTTYSIPVEYQFYGGGQTYNNFTVTPSSATLQRSTLSIYGNNTFGTISNTAKPTTIKFEGGSTQIFSSFNISGDSSSLVTITSTNTTPATLAKSAAWNVGNNSVNGGNNTGLSFSGTDPNYLSIRYITGSIVGAIKKMIAFLAFF